MANTLKIKRGTAATIPQGQLAEPLFTTDTYDLYIGKGGALGNQKFQKYITSGTATDFIKGDGTLDGTTYQATSEKGQNNGYASLDAGGKIPAAQLPNSVMEYKGTWDASTNTPTLADGTGNAGDVYICSVGGTVNFGAGAIVFAAGDWVVYSGSVWQKSINSNAVVSVNNQTGVVTITFDQLSPMTTLGDLIYGGTSGAGTRLAGNTTTTKKFLSQTGTGTASAAPTWETLASADIPNNAANTTGSAATLTTPRTLTIGSTGKTFDGSANVSWSLSEIGAAAALSGTINTIAYWDSASTIASLSTATYPSLTELSYVKGVTSAIQTQINAKADSSALANYLPLTGGTLTGALTIEATNTAAGLVIKNLTPNPDKLWDFSPQGNDLYVNESNVSAVMVFKAGGGNNIRLFSYTTNGFLKTSGGDGTLTVDNTTYQPQLNGTGFVKATGTTISYDNTSYLPLGGGTLTGTLNIEATNSIGAIGIINTSSSNKTWDISPQGNNLQFNESGIAPVMIFKAGGGNNVRLYSYASNGFLKTSASDGTLIVDTTSYLPLTSGTLSAKLLIDGTEGAPATSGTTQPGFLRGLVSSGDFVLDFGSSIGNGTAAQYTSWIQATDKTNLATTYKISLNPNGGNVGIGKLNPQYALDVVGTGFFSSNLTAGAAATIGAQIISRALYSSGIYFLNEKTDAVDVRNFRIITDQQTYATLNIQKSTTLNGSTYTDLMYFAQNGAASFSSSVTATNMTLTPTASTAFTIQRAGGYASILGTTDLVLESNGTNPLYLNVYSGALTYIGGALSVIGAATFSSSVTAANYIAYNTSSNYQLRLGYSSSFYYDIGRNSSDGLLYFYGNQTGANGYVFGGVDGERMRITSGGNVGIGTTTPGALLTVSSVGFDDTYMYIEQRRSGYAASLNLIGANDDGAKYNRIISQTNGGTNHWQIGGGGVASTMVFLTGGTERMRITSGGNVGIGTTAPSTRLHVEVNNPTRGIIATITNSATSGLTGAQLQFTQNTINDWVIGQPGASDAFAIWSGRYPSGDGTLRMLITSGGVVQIANSSGTLAAIQASERLNINGTVYATGYFEISDIRKKDVQNTFYSDNINAISYLWKDKSDDKLHIGYAAQQVQQYIPDAVMIGNDGTLSLDYNQVHTWKIAQLEAKIVELEAKLK